MSNNLEITNDNIIVNSTGKDFYQVEDSVKAIGVKIEAARSGRVNGNLCFYTPKAMRQGTKTFIDPFPKHIQSKHNGEALGPITEVEYVPEMFPHASKEFLDIVKKVTKHSEESNGKELVKAVKELIKTPEYRDETYRGLGIANIYADIHDPEAIHDIKTRQRNKGTVSIGGKSSEIYCSVCGERYHEEHEHKKGNVYNDEVCFHIHNDLLLDHCGFVTVPADKLTNTEIVKDQEDENLKISITHFEMERCMQLEQLKEAIKDASAVKTLIAEKIPDESKQTQAFDAYDASLKNSRGNHYLISEGKLLNLRTVVGVKVAEDLIAQLDDQDENKAVLKDVVEKAKAVLGFEDTEKALEEFLNPAEEPKTEEGASGEGQDEATKTEENATQQTTEGQAVTETPAVEVKDMQTLLDAVSDLLDQKFEAFKQTSVKVQDSQTNEFLANEVKNLRNTLDADEEVIKGLQSNYKDALIELIKTKKGEVSETYLEKLKARSVDELKLTLEDLTEASVTKQEETQPEKDLEPATKTDAIAKVEDQQQDIVPDETQTEAKEDDQTTETVKVEDGLQQTPEEWLRERTKEVGLGKAAQEFKKKFGK